jgi:hypothetical protein
VLFLEHGGGSAGSASFSTTVMIQLDAKPVHIFIFLDSFLKPSWRGSAVVAAAVRRAVTSADVLTV